VTPDRPQLDQLLGRVPDPWRKPTVAGVLVAVGWPVGAAVLPNGLPVGIVLLGAVLGSLTGLTAMGLVLVYRASRIVNFAQAALGSAAGVLSVLVFTSWGVNYFLAFGLGLVAAAGAGALVEMAVVRRFFWAPRLILTLATIGLAQILGGFELLLPRAFGQPLVLNSFKTPLSGRFSVRPILFTGSHIFVLIVVPVVGLALAWFLRRTAAGTAIRAASENAERAMLMGIPVRQLSTAVWAIAAALSALTVMLTAPIQPLPPTVLAGPALLLAPLAAAVLARMESLPMAFAAGVGAGVLQQATFWSTSRGSLTDVAFLAIILGALVLQRHQLTRADDAALSSWVGASETPPVPAELRSLPEVVWGRRALVVGVVALAVALPGLLTVSQLSLVGTVALTYAIVGVSLVILTGWAGQLSLGQFAIAGVGAVAAANVLDAGADLLVALPAAGAAGALAALLVGLPALRIRGLFLGVTTLALAVAMSTFFLNPSYFEWALPSDIPRPVLLTRFDLADERTLYYFSLTVLALVVMAARGLRAGRPGRVLVAVRDNERAAQARGVHALRTKLMAFGVSGAVAGIAGCLHVLALQGISFGAYSPSQSFEAFSMVVIGGLTSVTGALVGAFALRGTEYAVGGGLQLIVTGTGVLLLLLVFPGGLGQLAVRVRQRVLRVVATRRDLVVPSLVADRRIEVAEPDGDLEGPGLEELLVAARSHAGAAAAGDEVDPETTRLRAEAAELRARVTELERLAGGRKR
jgi:branched-chain amino acid transport system permease protein